MQVQRFLWISPILFLLLTSATRAGLPEQRFQEVADRVIRAIDAGDSDSIEQMFNRPMQAELPLEKTAAFFKNLIAQAGSIRGIESGWQISSSEALVCVRFEKSLFDLRIVLDEPGKIAGLRLVPPARPERNETALGLPFEGRWLVFWGGDTTALNHHHDTPNQRHAFDFLGVDKEGRTRQGAKDANDDFYAFGRPIHAPADGIVSEAIDGVRDNNPGSMNPYLTVGNCVIIQHGPHEFSVLAHLKRGSVLPRQCSRILDD